MVKRELKLKEIQFHLTLVRFYISDAQYWADMASIESDPYRAMEYDSNCIEAKAKAMHHIHYARKIRRRI